jgi:multicomponent Na+:H+ antiporter subunit E
LTSNDPRSESKTTGEKRGSRFLSFIVVFLIMAAFWVLLSGIFDAYHLTLGFLCCLVVAAASHDLMFRNIGSGGKVATFFRFCAYVPWLMWQIVLANLHVAWLVINPKGIDPRVTHVKTKLKTDFAKVTYGNSITLTPGTITMDIDGDDFYVHSLSRKVEEDLEGGDMERRVAHVFNEKDPGAG